MPTLSVIICNYNHGLHIGNAIDAIVNQSRKPDELLIIEDGSTDQSVSVIEPYIKKYNFIKLFQNPGNRGLIYSFARGLDLANGDFIYGGSADDFILPGFFEKAMAQAEKYPECGAILGQYRRETPTGRRISIKQFDKSWKSTEFHPPQDWARHFYIQPFAATTPATLFNRIHFIEVGGLRDELGPICDWFATHAVLLKFGGVYIPEPLAVYVEREDGFSANYPNNPERVRSTLDNAVKLMQSAEFADRFSTDFVDMFKIYGRLMMLPYNPEEIPLVPKELYHIRDSFVSLANWDSPVCMVAAQFIKAALFFAKKLAVLRRRVRV